MQRRFPGHLELMDPRPIPRARIQASAPIAGEYRIRLPYLFTDRDDWWEVIPRLTVAEILARQQESIRSGEFIETPDAVGFERIPMLVDDAIDKIVDYGVPWLIEQCRNAVAAGVGSKNSAGR